MKRTQTLTQHELHKADGTKVTFNAMKNSDGILIDRHGCGFFIGSEVAGFDASETKKPVAQLPDELKSLALRHGDNRGNVVMTYKEATAAKREASKDEKAKKNDFLKQHGYTWKKVNVYVDANVASLRPDLAKYEGDMAYDWQLRKGGKAVNHRDGALETLLIELGYYGEEKKAEAEKVETARDEKRDAIETIETFFEETEGETPDKADPKGVVIKVGSLLVVLSDDAVWKVVKNTRDGDDWSQNNCRAGVATRYPRDEKTASAIYLLK